jgi:2',3'-cyclic-nucleotide 2'-phosphodiesterase
MKILYIGDITSRLGRETTAAVLPDLIKSKKIDYVIAQGENVSHGKGLQPNHAETLEEIGIDFFTGGNHSLSRTDSLTTKPNVLRPANLPEGTPGVGHKLVNTSFGKILIISLQGQVVGADAGIDIPNPLTTVDKILEEYINSAKVATIVNFHGDYSSEKIVMGQYLDGKVSAVIGDHWHVTTADAEVLPKGTAYITDIGMTGALDSSLGVKTDIIIQRWKHPGVKVRNEMEDNGRRQFNGVIVDIDTSTGLAKSIQLERKILS